MHAPNYDDKPTTPKLISFVGRSNSGKTTLITQLIPVFCRFGLRVGSIKHTHHDLTFDEPGKDSWKHRQAGSSRVLLLNNQGMAMYSDPLPEYNINKLSKDYFSGFDLVFSEGFKNEKCLKVEVYRPENNKTPLYLDSGFEIQAVISNIQPNTKLPFLPIDNHKIIVQWICDHLKIEIETV